MAKDINLKIGNEVITTLKAYDLELWPHADPSHFVVISAQYFDNTHKQIQDRKQLRCRSKF